MEELKQKAPCHARCKTTEKCYGKAYYLQKPGKSEICIKKCRYLKYKTKKIDIANNLGESKRLDNNI